MSYRPLIRVSGLPNDTFLPNTNSYTAAECSKIKKYLPKFLSMTGVDASSQIIKQELQKEKLKLKSVAGKDASTDADLKWLRMDRLRVKVWRDVAVRVNIPFNSRHDAEEEKEQLSAKLEEYVENYLQFTNSNGDVVSKTSNNTYSLEQLDIFFSPAQLNPEAFDNSYRQIRCVLQVGVLLAKKDSYSIGELLEIIKPDVVSSLKIMIKSKMSIRVLRSVFTQQQVLVLQSFVAKLEDVANQEKKLDGLLTKALKEQQIQPLPQPQYSQEKPPTRKELSNRQLLMILVGLFLIYLFLKIYPLDRIISNGL